MQPEVWKVAVCLYDTVTMLDFMGPVELLGFLSPDNVEFMTLAGISSTPLLFDVQFLSHNLDSVKPVSGPRIIPDTTYSSPKEAQYDVVLIPGGLKTNPKDAPPGLLEFIKKQAPGAKYIMTVCTGSEILSGTGLLDGKRATTNKFSFKNVKATTSEKIQWVAKARWVVDGNVWTSSGVTAGADMMHAFLNKIVGEDIARVVRGVVELSAKDEGDDEFAEFHGLV